VKGVVATVRTDPIGTLRKTLPRPIFKFAAKAYSWVMTPLWSLDSAQQRAFERRLGVSTGGTVHVDPSKLADRLLGDSTGGLVDSPTSGIVTEGGDNSPYEPCRWLSVRKVIKDLRPGTSDVFLDFGSGKGQVLLIAALFPFKRVTGVEYDQELAERSRRNIEIALPRLRTRAVECITADVLESNVDDDASVVFMFNPFIGQTFRSAMGKVFASFDRNPRDLHIVYAIPWEHDWLISTGRVVVDGLRPCQWPVRPWWWRTGQVIVSYRVIEVADDRDQSVELPRRWLRPPRAVRRWTGANGHDFVAGAIGREVIHARSRATNAK
jgi:SAM-dependent methyltransferase